MRFRLDPISPDHPSWSISSTKEAIFVGAPAHIYGAAREYAANRLITAGPVSQQHQLKAISPWLNDKVTNCVMEPNLDDLPDGTVVLVRTGEQLYPLQA